MADDTSTAKERAKTFLCLFKHAGLQLSGGERILDLGCGNGALVCAMRAEGVEAVGCDISFKQGENTEELIGLGIIKKVELDSYKLPYPDHSFDGVYSDQVIEHVMHHEDTHREVCRVMKPGAFGIHIFPSRYTIIEPHVRVPLATVLKSKWWLRLWHSLGVGCRAGGDSDLTIVEHNHRYLRTSTNFLPPAHLNRILHQFFSEVKGFEGQFLRCRAGARLMAGILGRGPGGPFLYSLFRDRVVLVRKSR